MRLPMPGFWLKVDTEQQRFDAHPQLLNSIPLLLPLAIRTGHAAAQQTFVPAQGSSRSFAPSTRYDVLCTACEVLRAPGLSLTGIRLVVPDHASEVPVLRAPLLCTFCRHYPGGRAGCHQQA